MSYRLKDLAAALGAETLGDASLRVDRLAEPAEARAGDLALAVAPGLAFAQCAGFDHTKSEQVTMSCAAGSVYDAETERCGPTTG